ncbi:MAG: DUF3592 domain-containing protein [Gemmataceae bacterium]|nr:DUF3592 domain-containing protein [Gemmataceae bacterium]
MSKIRCVHCGSENDPNECAGYCDECGKKLGTVHYRPSLSSPVSSAKTGKGRGRNILWLFFIILPLVGIAVGIWMTTNHVSFAAQASRADGVVVHSFQPTRRSLHQVTVRFVANNRSIEFTDHVYTSHSPGDRLAVLYRPENPEQARIKYDGLWEEYKLSFMSIGGGILFLLVILNYWRKDVSQESEEGEMLP